MMLKNIQKKMGHVLCCFLGMWMVCRAMPLSAGEEKQPDSPANIVTVDIPYSLFVSLVAYQELTEMENTGKNINSEMIPVLENIMGYLRTERKKYENLNPSVKTNLQYRQFLLRLDSHIDSFYRELLYRRKIAEYESLLEKQKTMMEK